MEEKAGRATNADLVIFEEVFKTHFKNLHTYARSIVKDDASAEEIVQQVFYKLWEKKEQIKIQQSLVAYLYKAVYNDSLNYLKHEKVKASYKTHAARTLDEKSTTDHASVRELQQKIETAINGLPEQCRTIFQLSRIEELKYREIADKLGLSIKTVENQMGKALRVLREKLAEFLPIILIMLSLINLKKMIL